MRLLVKFGYLGWLYSGYQKGNGDRSVEDTILKVLRSNDLSESLQSAARTDRGVSAISNVIAVDTTERPSKVLGILNSSIDGMIFHGYAVVPDDFNPRHNDYKIYRYILPGNQAGPYLRNALKPFRGKHDFRNFCRLDERNPVRTINSIRVKAASDMVYVDFKARSFLWNQIRTIMAYAVERSGNAEQTDPFERKERYGKMLEPESLVLLEMVYDGIEFKNALSISKVKQFAEAQRRSNLRNRVMQSFSLVMGDNVVNNRGIVSMTSWVTGSRQDR